MLLTPTKCSIDKAWQDHHKGILSVEEFEAVFFDELNKTRSL